ncbi:MAG: HD domain-containing protein [Planctomycetota bacterium]
MWTTDGEASAPRTVGVIDIGSNSVRMAIAQVLRTGELEVLERTQRPMAMGHDTFLKGRLGQQAMNTAIGILRDYGKLLDTYGVETVRAVATSAVREASNAEAFVDRVAMAVGLDLDVLDPTEESRLTVSAVREAVEDVLDVSRDSALIADVGGGSTLLTVVESGVITASESYAIGSIRLQEHMATTREAPERTVELLRYRIANVVDLVQRSLPVGEAGTLLAVGEDARFAAEHAGEPVPEAERVATVDRAAFDELVDACARRSAEQLASRYGLPFPNAVRLVPALLIYQAVLQATGLDRMVFCNVSMRDGLLLDLARRVTGEEDTGLAESVVRSAKTIGEKYRVDPRHAEHVANLAVELLDELQGLHGLGSRHRLLMRVAGTLHEVGKFISNRAHHKHCYYVIANSEIFGLSRREIGIVAHVARYHRRSAPKKTHLEYMTLPREDRMVVNKLASLLRVADALDRGHQQQIRDLSFERRGNELILYVGGVVDLTLERRAMAEKADMFEETFGLRVRVEEAQAPMGDARRARPVE